MSGQYPKNQDFSKTTNTTFDLYRPLQADFTVLDSLNYQPEFNKEPWDYHAALVDPERVSAGINLKHKLYPTLSEIEQQYGVKKQTYWQFGELSLTMVKV